MNFILIGKGKWGSKLYKNLKKIGNVKKVFRSKDNYKFYNFKNIDWVIVASPNRHHFQQVRSRCLIFLGRILLVIVFEEFQF